MARCMLMKYDNNTILSKQLDRINREVTNFKGVVDMWDVINEVVIMPIFDKYDNAITRICKDLGRVRLIKEVFDAAKAANPDEINDLKIAWKIAALTKSNCVVYVKDSTLLAIGMGMTSRVDAARAAVAKANDMGIDLKGCALASEAFFPFADSIEIAASVGVANVIQPGGSIRDEDVIEAANKAGISMYFTGIRHFLH